MNIVVLDGYALNPGDLDWAPLGALGKLQVFERTSPEQVMERARGAHIILTNKTRLPGDVLSKLPELGYIGLLATGYDVVDTKAARERGMIVTNVPGYGSASVAQHVFALLLELTNQVGLHSRSVTDGEWSRSGDWCRRMSSLAELEGKTMGIVGYGAIGERTARIAHGFGMKVAAYRRSPPTELPSPDFAWVGLHELFSVSDVVSLHCPLTAETEGMINASTIAMMKPGALLINTARGKLIAERDLADALNEGRIAGAGLDVLSAEPPDPDHPLASAKRCVITPHVAWATQEARSRLLQSVVRNISAYQAGAPVNVVNR
ncbi:D-2-hydroxyacid dehydrogenase [Paenibacillus antri]|uniref:D-2-hydroxyacid dehydrogenase n=1 Tax=Paenibacillus antri TaxID=2582848 RepID=A0A5R9GHC7_9BACL|nr:D-2-hydroxyacid dehydrogenase [Paenibacillus antri]TLS53866.1 D-2-hydroxyacid dehydrogenase [Paenibacillus antri]